MAAPRSWRLYVDLTLAPSFPVPLNACLSFRACLSVVSPLPLMLNCAGITVDYDRSWMAASQVGGRVCVLDFRTGYVLQKLKICDGEIQQVHHGSLVTSPLAVEKPQRILDFILGNRVSDSPTPSAQPRCAAISRPWGKLRLRLSRERHGAYVWKETGHLQWHL